MENKEVSYEVCINESNSKFEPFGGINYTDPYNPMQ